MRDGYCKKVNTFVYSHNQHEIEPIQIQNPRSKENKQNKLSFHSLTLSDIKVCQGPAKSAEFVSMSVQVYSVCVCVCATRVVCVYLYGHCALFKSYLPGMDLHEDDEDGGFWIPFNPASTQEILAGITAVH